MSAYPSQCRNSKNYYYRKKAEGNDFMIKHRIRNLKWSREHCRSLIEKQNGIIKAIKNEMPKA